MREIALHLLDIAENSVAAQARNITIRVVEDLAGDRLYAAIQDDGKGMAADLLKRITDPFVTSRTTRKVGLGIPFLKAAAEACNGHLQIVSNPGRGTCLEVDFQRSHIDRMPLGDLGSTFLTLVVAYPEIHWLFTYQALDSPDLQGSEGERSFHFDSQPVREALGDVTFSEPEVLAFLRSELEDGIEHIQNALPEAT